MTTIGTETAVATQVYRVFVKAAPAAIWDAITKSEWTERYGYGGGAEYDLRPGGVYRAFAPPAMKAMGAPDVIVEGEIAEADAPRRLSLTWHPLFDPEVAAEPAGRLTWEIDDDARPGVTRLTLTHELESAPKTAAIVGGEIREMGGGWAFVLSDLKTLLETGKALEE